MPLRAPPPTGLLDDGLVEENAAPGETEPLDGYAAKCLCVGCDLIEICFVGRTIAEAMMTSQLEPVVSSCQGFIPAPGSPSDSVSDPRQDP